MDEFARQWFMTPCFQDVFQRWQGEIVAGTEIRHILGLILPSNSAT